MGETVVLQPSIFLPRISLFNFKQQIFRGSLKRCNVSQEETENGEKKKNKTKHSKKSAHSRKRFGRDLAPVKHNCYIQGIHLPSKLSCFRIEDMSFCLFLGLLAGGGKKAGCTISLSESFSDPEKVLLETG